MARLVYALDATESREASLATAAPLAAALFAAGADAIDALAVKLVYFRGGGTAYPAECKASKWLADAAELQRLMAGIHCRAGRTQLQRVMAHTQRLAVSDEVRALVYIGDSCEEPLGVLEDKACGLAEQGVPMLLFHDRRPQEGPGAVGGSKVYVNPATAQVFQRLALITGGAYVPFSPESPQTLATLLRSAGALATGGRDALDRLARREGGASRALAAQLPPP